MNWRCVSILMFVIAWMCSLPMLEGRAATQYSLTDLGGVYPSDINDLGQVLAEVSPLADPRLLMPGAYQLPMGIGFPDATVNQAYGARAINNFGQISVHGYSDAHLWTPSAPNGNVGVVTDFKLPSLESYRANDMGDDGTVVGHGYDFFGGGWRSFVWKPSSPNATTGVLHTIGGGVLESVLPNGINDRGNIVGRYWDGACCGILQRAFVFRPTVPNGVTGSRVFLQVIQGGGNSSAESINDVGQIVGSVMVGGVTHAFLWSPDSANASTGAMQDLGLLPSRLTSRAVDINSHATVVGTAGPESGGTYSDQSAFVWTSNDGLQDLNTLLGAGGVGWHLSNAASINERGQIVGVGIFDPDGPGGVREMTRGFLLTPIPEPNVATLLISGLFLVRLRVRNR
jgi:probable HAF family extracellular repeat protein